VNFDKILVLLDRALFNVIRSTDFNVVRVVYERYLRGPWPTPWRRRMRLWWTASNPARILSNHPSTSPSTIGARASTRIQISGESFRETRALWNIDRKR